MSTKLIIWWSALCWVVLLASAGCSTDDTESNQSTADVAGDGQTGADTTAETCDPGAVNPCVCADARAGQQVCQEDGTPTVCSVIENDIFDDCSAVEDQTPSLQVISPTPNEVVTTLVLQVQLEVRNFNLVPRWGEPNVEGEGHFYVTLDGNSITAEGEGVTTTTFGIDLASLTPRPENTHVFRIEARNNDRSLFDQIAPVVVTFTTAE